MDNCGHSWGDWKTVKTNSDGSEEQERTCRKKPNIELFILDKYLIF
jgi:hypothetical protein